MIIFECRTHEQTQRNYIYIGLYNNAVELFILIGRKVSINIFNALNMACKRTRDKLLVHHLTFKHFECFFFMYNFIMSNSVIVLWSAAALSRFPSRHIKSFFFRSCLPSEHWDWKSRWKDVQWTEKPRTDLDVKCPISHITLKYSSH